VLLVSTIVFSVDLTCLGWLVAFKTRVNMPSVLNIGVGKFMGISAIGPRPNTSKKGNGAPVKKVLITMKEP